MPYDFLLRLLLNFKSLIFGNLIMIFAVVVSVKIFVVFMFVELPRAVWRFCPSNLHSYNFLQILYCSVSSLFFCNFDCTRAVPFKSILQNTDALLTFLYKLFLFFSSVYIILLADLQVHLYFHLQCPISS